MRYLISKNGANFVIGLIGTDEEAEEDINWAHNMNWIGRCNIRVIEDRFKGRLCFSNMRQFWRMLLTKNALSIMSIKKIDYLLALKESKQLIRDLKIEEYNFMNEKLSAAHNYKLGTISAN